MTTVKRTFPPALVEEFRRELLAARSRLLQTIATTDDEVATLEAHQPGAFAEDVPREGALAVLSRLGDREKHELDEIHAAYSRLEAGIFGVCEGCRGELPVERLRSMPTARYCLACQRRREGAGRRAS